ncbi:helix-turn-helix domain-containing protein [Acidiphilium sp.]|uniref:helix-turn-helix domain-containing protein n=1 Tax=Acidiphilium sp. TaxID=527 RepID=UPI002583326A|nr:helix-turn-helix domain-containing protein [Acidiphilium sp.]
MTQTKTYRDRMRERLEALGLSPRAASLKAGLSTHFLQRVFAQEGTSLGVDNLLKLADVLETSPEWLLTGSVPGDPPPGTERLFEIYMALDEAGRKTLMDFAEWTLHNRR